MGITRLNVYAGLAGFYILRDELDTGREDNPLGLPAEDFELAYVIQDHMFKENGEQFYPAFPGDPTYEDFIVGEGAELPDEEFPNGGPTALAEFFGDFMLVNGKIWPKAEVEPREYRLRLLNGCDSRYLVIQFMIVDAGATNLEGGIGLDYTIIGSDGGLGDPTDMTGPLVFEPAGRYDIVIDFTPAAGQRVIMMNLASDAPFGGDFGDDNAEEDLFEDRQTDRIMAFDVHDVEPVEPKLDISAFPGYAGVASDDNTKNREVALFEGLDEYGRLQPLLGAKADEIGASGLFPAYTWSNPTTETPELGSTEEWFISNFSADGRCLMHYEVLNVALLRHLPLLVFHFTTAHPIHLHLVNFEIVSDYTFTYNVDDDDDQVTTGHMGTMGVAPRITSISAFTKVEREKEYYDGAPKDMVVVRPGNPDELTGRGTIIRVRFPKKGRFVWHCHILRSEKVQRRVSQLKQEVADI